MTVPEVVVTMLIFSIVIIAIFGFLDSVVRTTARTDRNAEAESTAQLALRTVTQELRAAQPVKGPCTSDGVASPALPTSYSNCIQFDVARSTTAANNCARTEFLYALVDSTGGMKRLIENRREVPAAGSGCDTTKPWRLRRVLLERVANNSTQPFITYFDAQGNQIMSDAGVPEATSARLRVFVSFQDGAAPTQFTSDVAIRNNR